MKILNVEEAPLGHHLKSFVVTYKDKNNRERKWEMVSRGNRERVEKELFENIPFSDGAQIVAFNREKQTVIINKEYRIVHNGYLYSFPAGLLDPDETIEESAVREFKEETGLTLHPLSVEKARYTTVGITDEKVNIVFGTYEGEISTQYLEASEDIIAMEIDREEARRILEKEEVTIRTAAILMHIFRLGYPAFYEE